MSNIVLIFSLFLLASYSALGQEFFCGTSDQYVQTRRATLSHMANGEAEEEGDICLRVFFHIVKDDNGNEVTNSNGLKEKALLRLNRDYSSHGISFEEVGFDEIHNSIYLDFQYKGTTYDNLVEENHKEDAINIYLVERMYQSSNNYNRVILGRGKMLTNNLVIMKDVLVNNKSLSVVSHEMGHCFSLYHTHRARRAIENGTVTLFPEDENNCSYEGDFLCDTPPDSGLNKCTNSNNLNSPYCVDSDCRYIKNDSYNPDTRNIMSYSSPSCLDHFSKGQVIRMRDAIVNEYSLKSTIKCDCSEIGIVGDVNACKSDPYSLLCPTGKVDFDISSNLVEVIPQDPYDNKIVVNSNGIPLANDRIGVIEATDADGTVYTKKVWIGRPQVDVEFESVDNYVFLRLVGVNYNTDEQNIYHIRWETLSTSGTAYMGLAVNKFENVVRGVGTNWVIETNIVVTNSCGSFYLQKTITPDSPSLPCENNFRIDKINTKEYAIFKIIDPCMNKVAQKERVANRNINTATLFDTFGNEIRSYYSNGFNVENIKEGVYIFKIQTEKELVVQKIIIE